METTSVRLAACVMVLGTSSGAGKSLMATALCRWYANQGLRVAPFKAQNMSNNARVVSDTAGGLGEIGSAQYFQALAACAVPDVRMNPVLLKPEADTRSQVIVLGQMNRDLAAIPWRARSEALWPIARDALDQLRRGFDVVVIEGAGSPAEINLHDSDYVNMRVALHCQAACLLVTDIDRGGAFAHLYGTWALLPPQERALIRSFVLNKFRGDAALLAPGPADLQTLTGVPTLAVVPMLRNHGVPEEDGLQHPAPRRETGLRVCVVAYPQISNLDEFEPLQQHPGVRLCWCRDADALHDADWIVLPGSKSSLSDLAWLRQTGIDVVVQRHARANKPVLGICGGYQMLGEALSDPSNHDGGSGTSVLGLGLLPVRTEMLPSKRLAQTVWTLPQGHGSWQPLSGLEARGFRIHLGHTVNAIGQDVDTAQAASVLGIYWHGLFENPDVLRVLLGSSERHRLTSDAFDALASTVGECFAPGVLLSLLKPQGFTDDGQLPA